ncbi:hypothetical protein [Streptomyces goshikiensis]|uniref:hypothetical protein n=1 Tax=Streptomyces goshikiensis TaxID=1942 RepID=UPI0036DAB24F
MATTGDGVRIIPVLRAAIEDGSEASAMLAGLGGGMNAYHDAAAHTFTDRPMNEALTTVSLTRVATDEANRTSGVLSATAPRTLIDMAMNNGFTADKARARVGTPNALPGCRSRRVRPFRCAGGC